MDYYFVRNCEGESLSNKNEYTLDVNAKIRDYLTQFAVAKPGHTVYFLIQELRKAVVRCLQLLYLWHMEM